jgi:hypothetical protein
MGIMSGRLIFPIIVQLIRNRNISINKVIIERRFSHSNILFEINSYSLYSKAYDSFSLNDSSFLIHKVKESTGRVVMFKEYNI